MGSNATNAITVQAFIHWPHVHWNLRIRYPPRSIPIIPPGMITSPAYKLASVELRWNWDCMNFGKKVEVPATENPSAAPPMVAKRKTLFVNRDFNAGKNWRVVWGFCSSGTVSIAFFFWSSRVLTWGISLGKPRSGMLASSANNPPKR